MRDVNLVAECYMAPESYWIDLKYLTGPPA
jgi:hypothetical protein